MFSTVTGDQWHWRIGFDPGIDFCIWILEIDGLHVPPFDRNAERKGPLQAAGLTEQAWKQWVYQLISVRQYVSTAIKNMPIEELKQSNIVQLLRDPVRVWPGNPGIKNDLANAWNQYLQNIDLRRQHEKNSNLVVQKLVASSLWDDLQPYRSLLPPIDILLVEYPVDIVFIVPPASLLLSIGFRKPTESNIIRTDILQSIEDLVKTNRTDAS